MGDGRPVWRPMALEVWVQAPTNQHETRKRERSLFSLQKYIVNSHIRCTTATNCLAAEDTSYAIYCMSLSPPRRIDIGILWLLGGYGINADVACGARPATSAAAGYLAVAGGRNTVEIEKRNSTSTADVSPQRPHLDQRSLGLGHSLCWPTTRCAGAATSICRVGWPRSRSN